MENSTLRMTNIVKSNDKDEIQHALSIIVSQINSLLVKYMRNEPYLHDVFQDYDVDQLYHTLIEEANLIYYVCCFSKSDDLLSQWRGYANDGHGVAIGFNEFLFDEFLDSKDISIEYSKVSYSDDILRNCVKTILCESFDNLLKKDKVNAADFENTLNKLISWSVYMAVFYKNPTFIEENETRLVFYPFGNIRNLRKRSIFEESRFSINFVDRMLEHFEYYSENHKHGNFSLGKPCFVAKKDKIVSCIDISFSKIKRKIISDIVIGSKCLANDLDLRLFLAANDYDLSEINIRNSSLSYI
jgi:hypothetical protein